MIWDRLLHAAELSSLPYSACHPMSIQTRRKSRRHELDSSRQIAVMVFRASDGNPGESTDRGIEAKIVDISTNGFKLECAKAFEFEEKLVVEIRRQNETTIRVAADVRWVQPKADSRTWFAGCLISDSFPPDYIDEIARLGILDRRNSDRQTVQQEAIGRWELSGEDIPVRIVDVSAKGIGLVVDQPVEIGKRIRIRLEQTHSITARALWAKKSPEGFHVGCEVLEGSPFSIIENAVCESETEFDEQVPGYTVVPLLGISFLLILLIRNLLF